MMIEIQLECLNAGVPVTRTSPLPHDDASSDSLLTPGGNRGGAMLGLGRPSLFRIIQELTSPFSRIMISSFNLEIDRPRDSPATRMVTVTEPE
jgi:hypothetical protein